MDVLYGFKLLERFAISILPGDETVSVPAVYDGGCSAGTGKFHILSKQKVIALDDKGTFFLQFMPHIQGPRIFLGRRALI